MELNQKIIDRIEYIIPALKVKLRSDIKVYKYLIKSYPWMNSKVLMSMIQRG